MKIVDKENPVNVETLVGGDTFTFSGEAYILHRGGVLDATRLADGYVREFKHGDRVLKRDYRALEVGSYELLGG